MIIIHPRQKSVNWGIKCRKTAGSAAQPHNQRHGCCPGVPRHRSPAMRRVGLRLVTAVRPLAFGGGVGRWEWGGAAAGWGSARSTRPRRTGPSPASVPSRRCTAAPVLPIHAPCAPSNAWCWRPRRPAGSSSRGTEKGAVSPVWGRSGRSRGRGSAGRRALIQLAHGAAKYARASRAYAPTIRRQQGAPWGPARARESIHRLLARMNRSRSRCGSLLAPTGVVAPPPRPQARLYSVV